MDSVSLDNKSDRMNIENQIHFENYVHYSRLFFFLGLYLTIYSDDEIVSLSLVTYSFYLMLRALFVIVKIPNTLLRQ